MNTKAQPDIKNNHQKKYFKKGKDFVMAGLGIISLLYIFNITFGVVEFLPDNLPFVGNIDEALITTLLIAVLNYFNIPISDWFKRR
ncbi:MAG: DUF1232 domain-containing protein [Candidatus Pacebacteria bacterium]|nr:DUF1232 domain-containing protein [Candidatus Paceibacterota bacterium]